MTSAPRSVLVIGGTGGVGSGIVRALLAQRRFECVIVSSRDAAKLEALRIRANHPRLSTLLGSVDDTPAAEALLARAQSHGILTAVAASIGGWWEGPALTELDAAAWDRGIASLVRPHFIAARTFIPALAREHGRYLLVGGDAALTAVPHASLVSIAGAAQLMLARALVAERRGEPFPIIEELIVSGAVATETAHHGPVTDNEITAFEAGNVAAAMLFDGTTGDWPNVTRDGPLVRMHRSR